MLRVGVLRRQAGSSLILFFRCNFDVVVGLCSDYATSTFRELLLAVLDHYPLLYGLSSKDLLLCF